MAERFEDVAKLRYITVVVHETLRLRAVLPVQFMEARCDVALGDLHVPAGTAVFLLTRRCAMDARNFAEPERFEPERWLDAGQCPARTQRARELAFGGGPRTCSGRALALVECALVLSMVPHRFDLAPPAAGRSVAERLDFTMQPVGVRVRFRARDSAAGLAHPSVMVASSGGVA